MARNKSVVRRSVKQVERFVNTPIPATGPRVVYVVMPGRGIHRRHITQRALRVLKYLQKRRHQQATASELEHALHVTRNAIAGAVWELRQAHIVKSQPIEQV